MIINFSGKNFNSRYKQVQFNPKETIKNKDIFIY